MANRQFSEFSGTLDKGVVNLYMVVAFGVTGAPTLKTYDPLKRTYSNASSVGTRGIKSISRVSAGLYTITLQDAYIRFLGAGVTFENASASAAPFQFWPTPDANLNSTTTPTIQVQFANSSGVATDPANGEQVVINLNLQNSTAP